MMKPAIEGGIVVAAPPARAGQRGRPSIVERKSIHDWDAIAEWHRAEPGVTVRYMYVPSSLLTELKRTYPDLEMLGWHHHHIHDSRTQKELRKVCDVYVTFRG